MSNFITDIIYLQSIKNGTIGIMGGSFNPPHLGHLYISNLAIKKLKLNLLLWLIVPLSPFKKSNNLLSLKARERLCQDLTKNNYRIKVSTLEKDIGSNYSFNTLKVLHNCLPKTTKVIWVMGEDLLYSFHKFYRWKDFIKLSNIVIISRGNNNSFLSLNQKFPQIMRKYYVNEVNSQNIVTNSAPLWSFWSLPKINISSTQIRNKRLTK